MSVVHAKIAVCGFTGIIADTYITRLSVLSKAERYRIRSLNHQACKGESQKMSLKVKVFLLKELYFIHFAQFMHIV
jgi:hypothetical protein